MILRSDLSGPGWFTRDAPSRRRGLSSWLAPLLLLAFSLFGALAVGLAPREGQGEGQVQLAVIGPPWTGLEGMAGLVAAADGRIVEAGGMPNIIFAQSDRPDFVAALYRAGAWLVLDPAMPRGCLGSSGRVRG